MTVATFLKLSRRLPGSRAGEPEECPARAACAPGSTAPVRRVGRVASAARQAFLFLAACLFFLLPASPAGASVQGDLIVNRASLEVEGVTQATSSVTVSVVQRTSSTIEFLKYAAPLADGSLIPGAAPVNVDTSHYRTGSSSSSPFAALPAPTPLGAGAPLSLLSPLPLIAATAYHAGEPVFIRVTDLDQNLDHGVRETITTTIVNTATGETEVLRLTETGPDTGVFVGYIPSQDGSGASSTGSYNGVIPVTQGNPLTAHYVDQVDSSDSSTTSVIVDPLGIVFNSSTGAPIDGATVTLWDVARNRAATVFGDNGVSSFPSTVVTGSVPKDSTGRAYAFPPGGFRFPFIEPGTYQLRVVPPASLSVPSATSDAALAQLSGGPFLIATGSRGETFTVNPGPALRIDIPADPVSGRLWLQKAATKSQVSAGDFLPYQINVQNNDQTLPASAIEVTDRLPLGFRYRKGSTKLNGLSLADPTTSADGRTLVFAVGDLAPKGTASLSYVVEVSAGARLGTANNTAVAQSAGVSSNTATAQVEVRSDFLTSRSLILGRVYAGSCSEEAQGAEQGVAGVRIYLEDGSFVDTDRKGMFHFEGVTPTPHVVQLDLDSLPAGYVALPCEANSRFAGRAYSQFVEPQGGTLWRTDFHVAKKNERAAAGEHLPPAPLTPVEGAGGADGVRGAGSATETGDQPGSQGSSHSSLGSVHLDLSSTLKDAAVEYLVRIWGPAGELKNRRLTLTLPPGATYLTGSSELDGVKAGDPALDGQEISFPLGDSREEWVKLVRLRAEIKGAGTGDLLTRARLSFETQGGSQSTPDAENVLRRVSEAGRQAIPDLVLHPHFPTFGAELSDEDRARLDELALLLSVLDIEKISVTGHTDNVRIAPRSREIFRDNKALSLGRASSVGRYLIQKLHLPPAKLELFGFGETRPVASNLSAEGRAENRRVEIRVQAGRLFKKERLELAKERGSQDLALVQPLVAPKAEPAPVPAPARAQAAEATPEKDREGAEAGPKIKEEPGILSPAAGSVLIHPINGVRVCLVASLTPRLLLDGKEVSAERIGFTMKDPQTGKAMYSYIGVDFGGAGEHTLTIEGVDPFGNPRFSKSAKVTRSGEVVGMRLLDNRGNVADGKTPVRLKLELLDGAGHRIPAAADLEILEGELKPYRAEGEKLEAKNGKFEKVHLDAQGNALFQPITKTGLYRLVLGINGVRLEAETYLKPVMRDWILVGIADGTVGYHTIAGHMESVKDAGIDDKFYDQERVAFFAKGTVKGEWLVTAAYDSAKSRGATGNGLFQSIDPNTYYTLYGDASQQQYDAASTRKLYLKIERDQFYALFGDFDTGLTVTELSRYSRRLNGVKTEYNGKNFEVSAFGSQTGQSYVKDEIQGDGTSGLYHLTRKGIVINSDKVRIEVRDRFRSEVLISSRQLSRFADYSIDYDSGTLLFKEPIYSRDDQFNPIFIVAEYETNDASSKAITAGGRAGVKLLNDRVKAGVSFIHEGQVSGRGDAVGFDTTVKLTPQTTVKAEVAHTETNFGTSTSGNAYLAELAQRTGKLDSRVYYREIETGFGLGQQQGSEVGTRKFGVDAGYKLTDTISGSAQANRQYNLATGATSELAEGKLNYQGANYGASVGLRHASDHLGDGSTQDSEQLSLGASYLTLNKRLTLRANRDQSIAGNNNASYPTRTALGAEYKLTERASVFAQQEFTEGNNERSNATRGGVKLSPWEGSSVNSSLERNLSESADRVFALFGIKQTLKLTERWSMDAGLERSQTLRNAYRFNLNTPPVSGSSEDFTAVSLGAEYRESLWTWNGRVEMRTAASQDKWGVVSSVLGEVREGIGASARLQLFDTIGSGQRTLSGDLRFGLVYRPFTTRWIVLDRLDFLVDRATGGSGSTDNRRVMNNLSLNYKPGRKLQLSLQYGAKYVLESIDGADYSGFTDLMGFEGRYDITKKWDLGARGTLLHGWESRQLASSAGLSVGYNLVENAWLSLGYNFTGFTDKDFSQADYTAQGPYLRFRFKFDQNSVKDAVKWLNQ
ncbi:hypothetical protein GMST_08360 [Geomonas silvestris]|uniref:OmpA-like domain-containing protein n=1 Tax=Geomonas silvestris TaxID=2740184 RepID=A0A6V8MET4_9BACT|nr:OmpA family protein [Geomonas silvestris]GFO58511.1 hypothetical protein GMST_08360 [Geomonas silvestris]